MTSTIDRPLKKKMTEPTLAQMTDKAIAILSRNPEGFFLMVEGGEIDWLGHRIDAAGTLRDMQSFDEAVAVALDFAVRDGNTLLIVTADHETGGLQLPADPDDLNMDFLEGIRASTKYIWEEIEDGVSLETALEIYAGIGDGWPALTQEEEQAIESCGRAIGISDLFNARAGVTYSTGNCNGGNHTSTPVPVYAMGPGADQFDGSDLDNTDLGVLLLEAVSGD
jgi:alkaline phosphatase